MKGVDGIEVLRGRLAGLPTVPGVYRMLGDKGQVLYVGKARNLKARVTQYTQTERMGSRIRKMVFETRDLVVVEARSEAEALLLEANLIKSLKPKYNIIFRDDASYVRVLITDEEVPMIRSHRGATKVKGEYFGPYPSAQAVYSTLDLMERAFRLRSCADSVFKNRTRPCLKYDIKRCSGPCVGLVSKEDYARQVRDAKRFLHGERKAVQADLEAQMARLAGEFRYEEAAAVRDRMKAIAAVSGISTALTHALGDADVLALVSEHGRAAVQAFYYRNGQHVGNQTYFPNFQGEEDAAEALRVFVALHYGTRVPPPQVYCNVAPAESEVLAEALGVSAGRKVRLEVPTRGEKRDIVRQAEQNARAALHRKTAESEGWAKQMAEFGRVLGLESGVELVECYDISNISGKFPVASCVVAGPEGMLKNRYRKYAVKTKDTPDDYAMLREVLERRVVRGIKEQSFPTVMMVDGGKGQLNVLVQVMRDAGVLGTAECPLLVGIAKGEERDKGLETLFVADGKSVRRLPIDYGSALIFMLQRVRDEAHRFAITFHRQKRGKAQITSRLDGVPGIGARKKKALLLHFGSVEGVRSAGVRELAQVEGIGAELAQVIFDYFQKG
ncbi:MAG: excinuclease ABC subunit UvrC [Proteobacteria bacterium]|nr:excinuclease ABC subunit UvrC [Pseudomonadota bacterium]